MSFFDEARDLEADDRAPVARAPPLLLFDRLLVVGPDFLVVLDFPFELRADLVFEADWRVAAAERLVAGIFG